MKTKAYSRNKKNAALAIAAAAIFCAAVLAIAVGKESYLKAQADALLAMPLALFPWFYIAIAAYAALAPRVYGASDGMRVAYLIGLAWLLWTPPYFLTGFSYQTDTLGRMAQVLSINIEDIKNANWVYVKNFPVFFAFGYSTVVVAGVDALVFARFVFPLAATAAFVAGAYAFLQRNHEKNTAFIALALMIPMLYWFTEHPSPRMMGFALGFWAATLLLESSFAVFALGVVVSVALVFTHPLLPGFFLFITGVFALIRRSKRALLAAALVAVLWLGWNATLSSTGGKVAWTVENVLGVNLSDATYGFVAVANEEVWQEKKTLQSSIALERILKPVRKLDLNALVYATFGIGTAAVVAYRLRREKRMVPETLALVALFAISAAYTLAIPVITGAPENAMIGLAFILFSLSALMAGAVKSDSRKELIAWGFVFLATIMYPLQDYANATSVDTSSLEASGLAWVADHAVANATDVFLPYQQDLAFFTRSVKRPVLSGWIMSRRTGVFDERQISEDVLVWRKKTSKYYEANPVFERNVFDECFKRVENKTLYDRVYSNQEFKVFAKNQKVKT